VGLRQNRHEAAMEGGATGVQNCHDGEADTARLWPEWHGSVCGWRAVIVHCRWSWWIFVRSRGVESAVSMRRTRRRQDWNRLEHGPLLSSCACHHLHTVPDSHARPDLHALDARHTAAVARGDVVEIHSCRQTRTRWAICTKCTSRASLSRHMDGGHARLIVCLTRALSCASTDRTGARAR
jgi:hypothetical protein